MRRSARTCPTARHIISVLPHARPWVVSVLRMQSHAIMASSMLPDQATGRALSRLSAYLGALYGGGAIVVGRVDAAGCTRLSQAWLTVPPPRVYAGKVFAPPAAHAAPVIMRSRTRLEEQT